MDRFLLLRTLAAAALWCLLAWDGLGLLLNHPAAGPAPRHREILLAVALLWFVAVLGAKNRDDDWAGQV